MNKITYFGDGQNTVFAFSFNFFNKHDIQVKINEILQTSGYTLTPINNTTPSDIRYIGGTVSFNTPPKSTDVITIYRKIEPNRIVDYQPTEKIAPEILNQDFNFLIEVIKDCSDAIDNFDAKYADFTNQTNLGDLIQKLNTTQNQLNALGEISNIATKDEITALQNGTSLTTTGISNIVSLWSPFCSAINLNFMGTNAGEYIYNAEKTGIVSIVIKSAVPQTITCLLNETNSATRATIYTKTLASNEMHTIAIPVCKNTNIIVLVAENLDSIKNQRLFPFKGAK